MGPSIDRAFYVTVINFTLSPSYVTRYKLHVTSYTLHVTRYTIHDTDAAKREAPSSSNLTHASATFSHCPDEYVPFPVEATQSILQGGILIRAAIMNFNTPPQNLAKS